MSHNEPNTLPEDKRVSGASTDCHTKSLDVDAINAAANHLCLSLLLTSTHRNKRCFHFCLDEIQLADLGLSDLRNGGGDEGELGSGYADTARRITEEVVATRPAFDRALFLLGQRLENVQRCLFLDDRCVRFLLFALCNHISAALHKITHQVFAANLRHTASVVASLLGGEPSDWHSHINARSSLFRSGLLTGGAHDGGAYGSSENPTSFLSVTQSLSLKLYADAPLHGLLLDDALTEPKVIKTALEDFAYLGSEIPLIKALLRASSDSAPKHVLFAGSPGTGKTELAQLIGASLGYKVRCVRCSDVEGDPTSRHERLAYYRLGCKLLGSARDTLIVFDEVEDIFQSEHKGSSPFSGSFWSSGGEREKGWMTNLLETTQVPTLWITNDLDSLDPAYQRRFDYILQIKSPPRSVRHRMLKKAVDEAPVPPHLLIAAAESPLMTPADTALVARVLPRVLAAGLSPQEAFTKLITNRPGGVNRAALGGRIRSGPRLPFTLDWLHTNLPIANVLRGLQRNPSATLLFSGPPGTGKTELAKHLAQTLDKPLHLKKASDLLSKWVGESEKNIALAFADAQSDDAILFLDEADSFLQSRERAVTSWQITEVNELLAQLDSYNGCCVLATNFVDSLDRAVLRRMDIKLQFMPLRADAIEAAYRSALDSIAADSPRAECVRAVRNIENLCFGDFAAALRGLALQLGGSDDRVEGRDVQLAEALKEEVRIKRVGSGRAIGFF